jgi:hypothetical protein
MRYISLFRPASDAPATPEQYAAMAAFIQEAVAAGVLIATEGFGPSGPDDVKLRLSGGAFTVTDGPFPEAKEVIGGFAIMECASRDEVLDWGRRFLALVGGGESEIRLLAPMSPIDSLRCQP